MRACARVFESSLFLVFLTNIPSSWMPGFPSIPISEFEEPRKAPRRWKHLREKMPKMKSKVGEEATGHRRADRNMRQGGCKIKTNPHQSENTPDGSLNTPLVFARCPLCRPLPRWSQGSHLAAFSSYALHPCTAGWSETFIFTLCNFSSLPPVIQSAQRTHPVSCEY